MAKLGFNVSEVPEDNRFSPLPKGQYKVMIVDDEEKTSSKGHEYIALTIEVIEGDFKGRKLWENLNLNSDNATAVNIARQICKKIGEAIGNVNIQDTREMLNKPFSIEVDIKPQDDGEPRNVIKKWLPLAAKVASRPSL
jgi:hypothetical protein